GGAGRARGRRPAAVCRHGAAARRSRDRGRTAGLPVRGATTARGAARGGCAGTGARTHGAPCRALPRATPVEIRATRPPAVGAGGLGAGTGSAAGSEEGALVHRRGSGRPLLRRAHFRL